MNSSKETVLPFRLMNPRPKRYSCVFQSSWWLNVYWNDAHHHEVTVKEHGEVVGRLVYQLRCNPLGMKRGLLPAWAHLGGPTLAKGLADERKAQVLYDLIDQLPKNVSFRFACDSYAPNAGLVKAAFLRGKFSHRRVETYCRAPDDADILTPLSKKQRKHLRQAERDVEIISLTGDQLIDLYRDNLASGGKKSYLPLRYVRDIVDSGTAQIPPQVRVFAARKKREDGIVSPAEIAVACTWDTERYYFWLLTRPFGKRSADACHADTVKLLMVRAMEHAQSLGLVFDSDGVNSEGSAQLYRDLMKLPNAEWRDYYVRDTHVYRLFKAVRTTLSKHPRIKKF